MTVGNRVFSGKGAREEAARALTFTILSWKDDQTLQQRGQFRGFEILSKGRSGGLCSFKMTRVSRNSFIGRRATYSASLNSMNPVGTVRALNTPLGAWTGSRQSSRAAWNEQRKRSWITGHKRTVRLHMRNA
jgi:hypothetical protein